MPPSTRRRTVMRVWFVLTALLFATRCADQVKPYWKAFVGAQDREASAEPVAAGPGRLRVASWNLEWLDEPGRGPVRRGRKDYARLAHYASMLNADVIAVQEVASELALALVFPPERYAYHLASPGGSQRSGFVYRRGLPVQVHEDLKALATSTGLRAGADLGVRTAGGELRLLSIHLKAFCVSGALSTKDRDCQLLKSQLAPLEAWVDARARSQGAFAVLGDFNRTLEPRDALLAELDDGDPPALKLVHATPTRRAACVRSGKHMAVDHVLLGGAAGDWLRAESFREIQFAASDAEERLKLSDHCPLLLELAPHQALGSAGAAR